jgi:hypothetical protein
MYTFCSMSVETLGEALSAGWRIKARCAWGPRDGVKRVREYVFGGELDLQTLIWTRGRDFPLTMLESRLKCPRCGSRRVRVAFTVPRVRSRCVRDGGTFFL